uniref:GM04393p n=1 Tax=Drosophila melanogaster TaxID=7227 RepID=Q95SA8_DROME|nr:GM04393p [Drosophila melanogaster]
MNKISGNRNGRNVNKKYQKQIANCTVRER